MRNWWKSKTELKRSNWFMLALLIAIVATGFVESCTWIALLGVLPGCTFLALELMP